ncbi:MAG: DNA replication/repair protein RecF, partial [Thiothrix sp.]
MWLSRVTVQNCRIIKQVQLELTAQANVVYGGNASGKSSLLEALTLLARGRSFRTPRIAEVLRRGSTELTVSASVEDGIGGSCYPLGINKTLQATRIRINHTDIAQQAELSSHLPLTLMHPGSVELLTGGPSLRRAFLDWIAFYRFADFHSVWRNYQRVLQQRNACLRDPKQRCALVHWTTQLIALQPALHHYRSQALTALHAALEISRPLLASTGMPQLGLSSGFPAHVDIAEPEQ